MSKYFKLVFTNKFCCGWLAALLSTCIIITFDLYKWWQFLPILVFIYIGFRYIAFKYLDE